MIIAERRLKQEKMIERERDKVKCELTRSSGVKLAGKRNFWQTHKSPPHEAQRRGKISIN
jgi:hypothetical protein